MDLSSFPTETTFIEYMALRVHERSDVGALARDILARANIGGELGPRQTVPRFVVIDELLDYVTEFERETAAQAWTDYRRYVRQRQHQEAA